jgi:hypothetical protein
MKTALKKVGRAYCETGGKEQQTDKEHQGSGSLMAAWQQPIESTAKPQEIRENRRK